METFYKNLKAIVMFCVICLIFTMATDNETTQKMVLLVLLGTLLINSDTIIKWLKKLNN